MSAEILRALLLLAVFGAVLLLVEFTLSRIRASRGHSKAINNRLTLIEQGVSREDRILQLRRKSPTGSAGLPSPIKVIVDRFEGSIGGAGLKASASTLVLILALATAAIFGIAVWLVNLSGMQINAGKLMLVATFAVAAGFGLPFLILTRLAERRRKRMVEQFPVALDAFVRGLRAGHPVISALELVSTEMQDPLGSELGMVLDEVTYGADLRDALQGMADRCGVEDMQMFVVSLSIQGETGGNLAEILENLAQVIRERSVMLMKVRALSSEGRMTAVMLTLLPVLAFTGLFLTKPAFYLEVADDPYFIPGFAAILIAFLIGILWIRQLVDLKV